MTTSGDDEMMTRARNLSCARNVLHRPADGTVSPFVLLPMLTDWYAVHTPFVAHAFAARRGDYLVLCPACHLLPAALLRRVRGRWQVIATSPTPVDITPLAHLLTLLDVRRSAA